MAVLGPWFVSVMPMATCSPSPGVPLSTTMSSSRSAPSTTMDTVLLSSAATPSMVSRVSSRAVTGSDSPAVPASTRAVISRRVEAPSGKEGRVQTPAISS